MKKVLLMTGLSLVLLAGGVLATQAIGLPIAKAANGSSTLAVTNTQIEQDDATEVKGKEKNDTDKEVNPADEQKQLQSQAKITVEQSKAAALLKIKGTVQSVELENEDNKAVYKVVVKDVTGKIQEVIVDAKTGVVVKVELPDGEDQGDETADNE